MSVRPASDADLDAMIGMVRAFRAASPAAAAMPFHARTTRRSLARAIDSDAGLALVSGRPAVGLLVAWASPSPWAPVLQTQEQIFWVEPAARGRAGPALLAGYRDWARAIGAEICGLAALDDRAGAAFRRAGFAPAEQLWMERL